MKQHIHTCMCLCVSVSIMTINIYCLKILTNRGKRKNERLNYFSEM